MANKKLPYFVFHVIRSLLLKCNLSKWNISRNWNDGGLSTWRAPARWSLLWTITKSPATTCPWFACTATATTWTRQRKSQTRAATEPRATTWPGSTRTSTTSATQFTSSQRPKPIRMQSGSFLTCYSTEIWFCFDFLLIYYFYINKKIRSLRLFF